MGVITLKLEDSIERRLRKKAADVYGLTRGALSRTVEDALAAWFRSGPSVTEQATHITYFAYVGSKSVVEAPSLKELAKGLKSRRINPRDVEIISKPQAPSVEKLGLRVGQRAV